MDARLLKDAALSFVEFLFLLLLWMIFASRISRQEVAIGVAAAVLGAVGDAIVKVEGFAPFSPHARWVVLIVWEPWYVLKGTVAVFRELGRTLIGRHPSGQFRAVPYCYGGKNETAAAKRALFAAYMTISPDTLVVGLDRDQHLALLHQLGSHAVPELGRRLGAEQ
jgi:multisubunit Na+/H+ antiporter MnhE subunit